MTSHLQSGFLMSSKLLSLKSSTKKPVLNLDNPSASCICRVFVSNSSKLKEVIVSKFSILSSNLPISLIVNLLLSIIMTLASSGSYKYAGNSIVAIVIAASTFKGSFGSREDTPLITDKFSKLSKTTLSIRGR